MSQISKNRFEMSSPPFGMDSLNGDGGEVSRAAAIRKGVEVCKEPFGPLGGFFFLLHGVEEDVA